MEKFVNAQHEALRSGNASGLVPPGGGVRHNVIPPRPPAPKVLDLSHEPLPQAFDLIAELLKQNRGQNEVVSALMVKYPPMRKREAIRIFQKAYSFYGSNNGR